VKILLLLGFSTLLTGCGRSKPAEPAPEVRPHLSAVEEFDLRGKCADIVGKRPSLGLVGVALKSDVASHYNADTNRCYAEVTVTKNFDYSPSDIPPNYLTVAVYDAQTDEELAIASREGGKIYGNIWAAGGVDTSSDCHPGGDCGFGKATAFIDSLMQGDAE
jgi:hypothetical protein